MYHLMSICTCPLKEGEATLHPAIQAMLKEGTFTIARVVKPGNLKLIQLSTCTKMSVSLWRGLSGSTTFVMGMLTSTPSNEPSMVVGYCGVIEDPKEFFLRNANAKYRYNDRRQYQDIQRWIL